MNDPYDNGTPKYSTATSIYDALCEVENGEEIGILSEMFGDVSWKGQDYYYIDKGSSLKEKFEELTNYGNDMWKIDIAIAQIDGIDSNDMIYEALNNEDFARRIGFKKIFIDVILKGAGRFYAAATEEYFETIKELDAFRFYDMSQSLIAALKEVGFPTAYVSYDRLCSEVYNKVSGLRLIEETKLVYECRALLTSYDDFLFGLRANQQMYNTLEQQFNTKMLRLQEEYDSKVRHLTQMAQEQGVVLMLSENAESKTEDKP